MLAAGKPRDGKINVRLYDAWTGTTIWSRELAAGAKGRVVGQDEVALLEPDGQLEILSLTGPDTVLSASLIL